MELLINTDLITIIISGIYPSTKLLPLDQDPHAIMEEEELEVRSVTPTERSDKPSPARSGTQRSGGKKSKVWSLNSADPRMSQHE